MNDRSQPGYPQVRKGDVVDDYHGEKVADPYRWLEDDATTADVAAFITAENELTEAYLAGSKRRDVLHDRLTELWSFPRQEVPVHRGRRWFQFRNSGRQNQPVLYKMAAAGDQGEVLLDPNQLSAEGNVSVSSIAVSEDGALLAYATNDAGSDWMTWHVRNVEDATDLTDVLEWAKLGDAAWLKDGSGLFYSAPEPPEPGTELYAESRFPRILLHRIGTTQAEDEVVFSAPDEADWLFSPSVTDDGRYLVIHIVRGTDWDTQVRVFDLSGPARPMRSLVGEFHSRAEVVANDGPLFYLFTNSGAERGRIVAVDLAEADGGAGPESWREVVGEDAATLVGVRHCGGKLVCHYLEDARAVLRIHDFDGSLVRLVPVEGFASLDREHADGDAIEGQPSDPVVLFRTVGTFDPGTIWAHDIEKNESNIVWPSQLPFDTANYVTEQVFTTSGDGTRLPIFVSHRRDVVRSGDVPILLHGYGGFNIPLTPAFGVPALVWMERGGIFASANLRGGGEYGRSWHDAGRLAKKQNVFDDFAACARYFATSGWSRPERIAIWGGSNGGLLVGASINQRPELFGAAVAEVGVMDMLRFTRFTVGWAWTSDFGDPDDAEQYAWSRAYSPLHNVRADGRYPPTLLMTGDHDDRVVPAHSFKYAAAVQEALLAAGAGEEEPVGGPVLLRVETSVGHGHGKPRAKAIVERTDFLTFLELALGLS